MGFTQSSVGIKLSKYKHLKYIFKLKKVENTISVSTCVSRTLVILGFLQLKNIIYIYNYFEVLNCIYPYT